MKRRRNNPERGFTLIEVLVALFIVVIAITALEQVSTGTMTGAVETNRLRIAKMLLREKAEQVVSKIETGTSGVFEGYPGYEWEVSETEVQVTIDPPAAVRSVTIAVRVVSPDGQPQAAALRPSTDYGAPELPTGEDEPGVVRVTTLIDPPDAELKPPTAAAGGGGAGNPQPGGGGNPAGGGGGGR